MNFSKDVRTLSVFSHPNHELAIFGIIQRVRPHLLYLTDGGGEERVKETRNGLARLGLLDQATFLPYSEQSFYDALLSRDVLFFSEVRDAIRSRYRAVLPEQITCDAVEFYNPVHDIALPLVISAVGGQRNVFEAPLIYQREDGNFGVQIAPPELRDGQSEMKLTDEEALQKRKALEEDYHILRYTLGHVLLRASHAFIQEVVLPASSPLASPAGRVVRYDLRAKKLKSEGKVAREITREGHYLPLARQFLG
jgi:hypothetical protein